VRNPLYVASVVAITGQALLLSRPVLLVYAAAFLAITFFLVHWIEDPALASRFGQQFEDYQNQVPGWWPRLPRRTPRRRAEQDHRGSTVTRKGPRKRLGRAVQSGAPGAVATRPGQTSH
jgi:hypothetical protein